MSDLVVTLIGTFVGALLALASAEFYRWLEARRRARHQLRLLIDSLYYRRALAQG